MLIYSTSSPAVSPPSLALLADGVNSYLSMILGLATLLDQLGPPTVPPVQGVTGKYVGESTFWTG